MGKAEIKLEPSGERMIVDGYQSSVQDYVIYLLHLATYEYARQFVSEMNVLDYGCGSGYGARIISSQARSIVAVDVDEEAIYFAKNHYEANNIEFKRIDPAQGLPFTDDQFDTVLSFQVFEHVQDTAAYLSEIRRVLRPGGKLVLVTPDRSTRLLPFQKPWNRWHLKEYDREGLRSELSRHFSQVEMLGMTARKDMINVEIRRCTKIKWLTLPFTLPIVPENLRIAAPSRNEKCRRHFWERFPHRRTSPRKIWQFEELPDEANPQNMPENLRGRPWRGQNSRLFSGLTLTQIGWFGKTPWFATGRRSQHLEFSTRIPAGFSQAKECQS